jgi:hypothetical protein
LKDITIITANAPIGGYLQVNNNIGNVYSTIFEFSTGNWTTNDENNNNNNDTFTFR